MAVSSEENVNFRVTQGETFNLELTYAHTYQDTYQTEIIDPIDITGYNITMKFYDKPGSRNLVTSCTIGNGITIVDPVTGTLDIQITPAKTSVFIYPRTYYKIEAIDEYNQVYVFLQGWFDVEAGIL